MPRKRNRNNNGRIRGDDDKKKPGDGKKPGADKKRSHTELLRREGVSDFLIDDHDLDVFVRMLEEYNLIRLGLLPEKFAHWTILKLAQEDIFDFHDRNDNEFRYRLKEFSPGKISTSVSPLIGQLDALVHLTLQYSEGKLPPEIGLLPKLETLKIVTRDGSIIPPEIGNLRTLEQFVLECPLMKSLFEEVGNFTNLELLKLTDCLSLTGLPDTVGQLTKLKDLRVAHRVVARRNFPSVISQLPSLEKLWISNTVMREEWYPSLAAFRKGPAGDDEASGASSSEVANLTSLQDVHTYLSSLLFFPVNFFANSTKLTNMEIVCDLRDFSSIDGSYFRIIPSTLENLMFRTISQEGVHDFEKYLDFRIIDKVDNDDEEEEEKRWEPHVEEINKDDPNLDIWQLFPKVHFPYQALAWQHNLVWLRIDGSGSSGIQLSFSMMINLVNLEYMELGRCNIEPAASPVTEVVCLPLLTQIQLVDLKGLVNLQELNLPSLEEFCLQHFTEHMRETTVRVSGLLPALISFSITSQNYNYDRPSSYGPMDLNHIHIRPKNKLVVFEYDATAQLPKLKNLILQRCVFFGNTKGTAPPLEALDLPCLQVLRLHTCSGIFSSQSKFQFSKWLTPCLRHVRFDHDPDCQQHYAIPVCEQLDKLSTELLVRCPQLISLNLSDLPECSIRAISKGTLSNLPPSIRWLSLSAIHAFGVVYDTENFLELLGRCHQLGSIGNKLFGGCVGKEPVGIDNPLPSIAVCQTIGHLLSLNRARCRLFLGRQAVIAGLWPLILENPLRALKPYADRDLIHHDDVDNYSEVQEQTKGDGTNDSERRDHEELEDDAVKFGRTIRSMELGGNMEQSRHFRLGTDNHTEQARLLWLGTENQSDAIFLLLRERFLLELL